MLSASPSMVSVEALMKESLHANAAFSLNSLSQLAHNNNNSHHHNNHNLLFGGGVGGGIGGVGGIIGLTEDDYIKHLIAAVEKRPVL